MALADASLPALDVSRRYKQEEAKKKELEARLARQKTVITDFKVDLKEFCNLMRLELLREETRKAALHALIEEIVAHLDAMIEVKYRIRNRYRTASKVVKAGQDLRVCTATAVPPLWGYHIVTAKHGSTSHHPEGCSLEWGSSTWQYSPARV